MMLKAVMVKGPMKCAHDEVGGFKSNECRTESVQFLGARFPKWSVFWMDLLDASRLKWSLLWMMGCSKNEAK